MKPERRALSTITQCADCAEQTWFLLSHFFTQLPLLLVVPLALLQTQPAAIGHELQDQYTNERRLGVTFIKVQIQVRYISSIINYIEFAITTMICL